MTPEYLRTLGIRLEPGRFFSDSDHAGSEPVFVIDDKLARQYWPGEDPIGKRVQPTSGEGWHRIVGIVSHVMQSDLAGDSGRGVYYASLYQRPMPRGSILVKTSGDASIAAAAMRNAVRAADPDLPIYDMKPMETLLANSLAPRRFVMQLLGFFAAAGAFSGCAWPLWNPHLHDHAAHAGNWHPHGPRRREDCGDETSVGSRAASRRNGSGDRHRSCGTARALHRKSVVRGPLIRSPDYRGNGVYTHDSGSARELAPRATCDAG